MGKKKGSKPYYGPKKQKVTIKQLSEEEIQKEKKRRMNVSKNATIASIIIVISCLAAFLGRWCYSVGNNYFAVFFQHSESTEQALEVIDGLTVSGLEAEEMLQLEENWDYFKGSRLGDSVTMTASDGSTLHAVLYNSGSDRTLIVLQQFDSDSTSDFLPGAALYEEYGCNILLVDARMHGESGGDFYSYGYHEQQDLADWIAWTDETLGKQTYLIWGIASGANTALFADANSLLSADNVAGIVAESPYGSLHELAWDNMFKWYTLPAVPFLYAIEFRLSISKADFGASDLKLANVIGDTDSGIPVLFLYSTGDEFISSDYSIELYNVFPDTKGVVVGTGSHGTVYTTQQEEVESWIRENVMF